MLGRRDRQRWWKVDPDVDEVELRRDAGYEVIRLWVEARTDRQIRRLLFLSPGALPPTDGGPPCEACGRHLEPDQHLAACTVCLTVFHRDCLDRPDVCALVACQEELL